MRPQRRQPARPPRRRGLPIWLGVAVIFGLTLAGLRWWEGGGSPPPRPVPVSQPAAAPRPAPLAPVAAPSADDRITVRFARCGGRRQDNCVVDGDTIRVAGAKIRLLDIDTPETFEAQCAAEAKLGAAATDRLIALLNAGPFSLDPGERDTDRYGRLLRTAVRGGESIGDILVAEGLARPYAGGRRPWC